MITPFPARLFSPAQAVPVFCAALLLVLTTSAQPAGTDGTNFDGDFVMYLGLDLSASHRGTMWPVVEGNDASVRVQTSGRQLSLSLRETELKTATEPKLSRVRATIDAVSADRVYSLANDPAIDAIAQQMVMDTAQSHAQEVSAMEASATARTAASLAAQAGNPLSGISPTQVMEAQVAARNAAARLESSFVAPQYGSALPGPSEDTATYDGFAVRFRIATSGSHDNAYGVLRLMVRDPANPQRAAQALKLFNVRNLGPRPREIVVRQFGLPRGYGIDSYSIHIFANGREIPTNLSSNRIDLSEDEAHQFVLLRHLQANPRATLSAQIVPELCSPELGAVVSGQLAAVTVELAIDERGRVTAILPASGGAGNLSPEIQPILLRVRLLPALTDGKPVASRGTFALGELIP